MRDEHARGGVVRQLGKQLSAGPDPRFGVHTLITMLCTRSFNLAPVVSMIQVAFDLVVIGVRFAVATSRFQVVPRPSLVIRPKSGLDAPTIP